MIKSAVAALAAAMIAVLPAAPSESAAQSAAACRDDAHEFCRNLEPEHGMLARCLQEHSAALSSACRAFLQERGAHVREPAPTRPARHRLSISTD